MKFLVEVEVVDKIKPSSPTPPHLRRHDLSFLDQIAQPVFMPFLLFYHHDSLTTPAQKLVRIKRSLSKALAIFYPLAGRVMLDDMCIDCDDRGTHYVEARAHACLSRVIEESEPESLNPFVPFELYEIDDLPAAVQVTFFDCGGLALCLCISHKVADALSCIAFLNCWAALAREDKDCGSFVPDFGSAKLFPPVKLTNEMMEPLCPIIKEGLVTRRFVFGPSSISELRGKYGEPKTNLRPSRVEALRAFFLKRHMETTGRTKYVMVEAVNLRPRTVPPLSMRHFGNIIIILKHKMEFQGAGESDIVRQMRGVIGEVGMERVKEIQDAEEYLRSEMEIKREAEEEDMLPIPFTSLCRFPMYEVDMGWGKPAWVSTVGLPHPDMVSFWDARDGESIEVYVTLREKDMAKFEKDEELLGYLSSATPTAS